MPRISAQQMLAQIMKEHKENIKLIVLESRFISVRMVFIEKWIIF